MVIPVENSPHGGSLGALRSDVPRVDDQGQKDVLSNYGYVGEKGQRSLWLNPKTLPILGNVGIQLGNCK